MSDLVTLAREFVKLSDQLEATRAEIAKAVLNGGGGGEPVRPTRPARAPGGKPQPQPQEPQPNHLELAKQAESQILAMLKERPHRMAEISSEMKARQSTTSERLRRMREKGLIKRDGEGWAASAAP